MILNRKMIRQFFVCIPNHALLCGWKVPWPDSAGQWSPFYLLISPPPFIRLSPQQPGIWPEKWGPITCTAWLLDSFYWGAISKLFCSSDKLHSFYDFSYKFMLWIAMRTFCFAKILVRLLHFQKLVNKTCFVCTLVVDAQILFRAKQTVDVNRWIRLYITRQVAALWSLPWGMFWCVQLSRCLPTLPSHMFISSSWDWCKPAGHLLYHTLRNAPC